MSIRRAQDERLEGTPDGLSSITEIMDFPDAPASLSVSDVGTSRAFNNGAVTVTITPATTGGTPATYNVISTPGSYTASGASPVTVTGLQSNTAYTFQATGVTSASAAGIQSSASGSVTATTVPATPSAPTATDQPSGRAYNNGQASVAFTAPATGGKAISSYTVTSSPGSYTGTGSSSPITVTGLQSSTQYTYTVTATNANGTSSASSASAGVTATTVPQAPTIGTATAGSSSASVTFTAGATGGSTITGYTVTSSPGSITGTGSSSPITVSGLTNGTAYTFTVTATNANGTSAASSASNSVTPAISIGTFSLSTVYPGGRTSPNGFSTNDKGVVVGGRTSTTGGAGNLEGWYWNGSSWTGANSTYESLYRSVSQTSATEGQSIGGENNSSPLSTTNYFNGSSWSSATALPATRREIYGGGSFGNNSIVVVGGNDGSSNSTVQYYRTGTGAWSTGTAYPFSTPTSMTHYTFSKVFAAYNNYPSRTVYVTTSLGGAWTSTGVGWPMTFFELAVINGIPFATGNLGTQGIYSIGSDGIATYQKANPGPSDWSNFALTGRTNQIQLVSGFSSNVNQTWNYLATLTT